MHDAGPACADHSAKNEHNRANAAYYHLPNKFALNEAPRWRGPLAQRAADFIIGACSRSRRPLLPIVSKYRQAF